MNNTKAYNKAYYQKNKEKINATSCKWYYEHKESWNKYIKQYRETNLDNWKMMVVRSLTKLKTEVLSYYGNGKCSCVRCGYMDIRALSIDHIDDSGHKHRREGKIQNIYRWLRKNNFPEGYQTLCMNCQFIKRAEKYKNR